VALLVWILASAGFAFYVGNFGSYNETYGTLGGFVVLLIWFWISNLAVLFGLELNSEFERSRQISAGVGGAERQLQLDPRAEPKPKKTA
jgi:membrane protein